MLLAGGLGFLAALPMDERGIEQRLAMKWAMLKLSIELARGAAAQGLPIAGESGQARLLGGKIVFKADDADIARDAQAVGLERLEGGEGGGGAGRHEGIEGAAGVEEGRQGLGYLVGVVCTSDEPFWVDEQVVTQHGLLEGLLQAQAKGAARVAEQGNLAAFAALHQLRNSPVHHGRQVERDAGGVARFVLDEREQRHAGAQARQLFLADGLFNASHAQQQRAIWVEVVPPGPVDQPNFMDSPGRESFANADDHGLVGGPEGYNLQDSDEWRNHRSAFLSIATQGVQPSPAQA